MEAERWKEIEVVFDAALEHESAERRDFVEERCATDTALAAEVLALLAAHELGQGMSDLPRIEICADRSDPGRAKEPRASSTATPETSALGPQFGPYTALRELGRGGMGAVFLAARSDQEFDRQVAIKVLHQGGDPSRLARLRMERQILADLDHPKIARLFEGGTTTDGEPYLVMEYVEGEPIDVYCDHHRLGIAARLDLVRAICDAVAHAHRNLIVHRDIKPSNILVEPDGTPKLLDFGIAKLLDPTAERTRTGIRPLTPSHASPEQLRGEPITTASDVYSLGVLLYQLLTSRLPHSNLGSERLAQILAGNEATAPSIAVGKNTEKISAERLGRAMGCSSPELARRLRGDLDAIVLKALRSEPQERYLSVDDLAEDLDRYARGLPIRARRPSSAERLGKWARRNKLPVMLGSLAALSATTALVLLIAMSARVRHERDQAHLERDKAEHITDFMVDLFALADPGEERGSTITVREVLDRRAVSISDTLRDQPDVHAAQLEALGRVYRNLGLYADAEPLLSRALALHQGELGQEHPATVQSLGLVAKVTEELGDFKKAEALYREVLEHQAEAASPAIDHTETLGRAKILDHTETLSHLARLTRYSGDLAASEDLASRAIAEFLEVADGNDPRLATLYFGLAQTLRVKGDLETAEIEYRKALEIAREHLRDDDPERLRLLKGFGDLLLEREQWSEARRIYEELLASERHVFGESHARLAFTLNRLGVLHSSLGELDTAAEYAVQGLEMRRNLPGEAHPAVSASLTNLAEIERQRGNLTLGESLFHGAEQILRTRFGAGNLGLAYALAGRARCLLGLSRPTEAEPLLMESLEIRQKALPEDHPLIQMTVEELERCRSLLAR